MAFRRLITLTLALAAGAAVAHDHWLAADHAQIQPGDKLTLHLQMGEDLAPQGELALISKDIERFELYHGSAVDNLFEGSADNAKPLWSQTPDFEGEFLAVMTRARQQVEMSPKEFSEYVAHEGISGIAPTSRPVQRERYWRFLKLLGRVGGDEEGSLHHRFVGQQLEMVLIQNPVLLKAGDEEIVQVYFETKPLPGQTVFALHRQGEKLTELRATTDDRGVARFRLDAGGAWLLRTVYLRPCRKCEDADWESFWAAYTFELGS
jgi:hypothetical protein